MELTFKLIIENKIKTLEEETMLGLYNIILRMHKHAVKDYINVISYYYDEDLDKPKSEFEFNKIFRENFFEMFEHIEEDLKYRLKDLKFELIKRFDIKLDVSESLSDSESESESDSESESEIENKKIKKILGRPIEFKLTDDGKCLTNIEDPDKSESESEIENKKIKKILGCPIEFKLTKDGKLEFDGKLINNIEDINEINSKYDIDIIKIIDNNPWFFGQNYLKQHKS